MTLAELIALNKAYSIDISDRTYIVRKFMAEDAGKSFDGIGSWITKDWRFIAGIAIRKSDGFTVTKDQVYGTEIWS